MQPKPGGTPADKHGFFEAEYLLGGTNAMKSKTKILPAVATGVFWLFCLFSIGFNFPDWVVNKASEAGYGGHGLILFVLPFLLILYYGQWPAAVVLPLVIMWQCSRHIEHRRIPPS